jgi:hypothetical protein
MMKSRALLVPLLLAGLPFVACSSDKNHAEREATPEAQGRHPDYASMTQEELKLECISTDVGAPRVDADGDGKLDPPICATPDPGSRSYDCAKNVAGFDFAWLWDQGAAAGRATYTYDDNTTQFVVPSRTLAWEPPLEDVPGSADVCSKVKQADGSKAPFGTPPFSKAARFKGGPFAEYGGGFGQSFRTISNTDEMGDNPKLAMTPSAEYPGKATGAYDLSGWDGIAIWIRRGPLGMSTLRVGITERNSAEDLNSGAIVGLYPDILPGEPGNEAGTESLPGAPGVAENKNCRRWRLCGCSAGTPCSPFYADNGNFVGNYCFDPAKGNPDAADLIIAKVQACGETRCEQPNTSTMLPDPLYSKLGDDGTRVSKCTAAMTDDGKTDMFCWDPAIDPPPPAKRQRCNNPFSRPLTITTDWQLIKVPFTELRQADEANLSDDMDLKSVKQIVVTHGAGWTDFWIANLGFYKKL